MADKTQKTPLQVLINPAPPGRDPPRTLLDPGRSLWNRIMAARYEMRCISIALYRELGLKPWHEDVFDLDIDTPVPERLKSHFEFDQFCYVRDLRRQLVAMT